MPFVVDQVTVEGLLDHKSHRAGMTVSTVASTTITLTVASDTIQVFQGSTSGQIVKMPDATTLPSIGFMYEIHNDSTQNIDVQDNAGAQLFLLGANQRALIRCKSTASAAGGWTFMVVEKFPTGKGDFVATYPGTGLAVNYTGGVARFNGATFVVAAGTITLPGSTTNGQLYVDIDGTVKATASLPNGAMPLYVFTTTASAVTALTDAKEDYENNLVWGVAGDISAITASQVASAGVLEKYARADHVHASTLPLYKAGTIAALTFTGTPKKATVTFTTPYANTNYAVTVTGSDGRTWTIESKLATGFTINANANAALSGPVFWEAVAYGESV